LTYLVLLGNYSFFFLFKRQYGLQKWQNGPGTGNITNPGFLRKSAKLTMSNSILPFSAKTKNLHRNRNFAQNRFFLVKRVVATCQETSTSLESTWVNRN